MTSALSEKWSSCDKLIQKLRYKKVVKLIPKGCVLADCGCGDGDFLRYAQKRISRGYGVDIVRRNFIGGDNFIFLEGNLDQKIPLEDGTIDVVTGLAVLEHLNHPDVFIKEIFRILKTGGRCILTTPSPMAKPVIELLAYRIGVISEKDIKDHKRYFNADELRSLFGQFAALRIEYFLFGLNTLITGRKR